MSCTIQLCLDRPQCQAGVLDRVRLLSSPGLIPARQEDFLLYLYCVIASLSAKVDLISLEWAMSVLPSGFQKTVILKIMYVISDHTVL